MASKPEARTSGLRPSTVGFAGPRSSSGPGVPEPSNGHRQKVRDAVKKIRERDAELLKRLAK